MEELRNLVWSLEGDRGGGGRGVADTTEQSHISLVRVFLSLH